MKEHVKIAKSGDLPYKEKYYENTLKSQRIYLANPSLQAGYNTVNS